MSHAAAGRHRARRERLRELAAQTLPGTSLVITELPNIRYLTGFSGSNAVLVVAPEPGDDILGTDGRYRDQIAEQASDLPVVIDRDTLSVTLRRGSGGPYAVESSLAIGEVQGLRDEHGPGEIATGLVERLRRVKEADELAALARACVITAAAFGALADEIRVGVTELALARRLEQLFGELGAEDRAFDSIVGSGPNSAIPHHEPGPRRLERGDLLVIDAGARVDGYHADMTRTYVVGREPEAWQSELHGVVARAQAAATRAYLPGAPERELDAIAREAIDGAGYAEAFTHGLGHGVGLQIHEAPMIGMRSTGTLEADMTVTVEPGVYLTGRGGVRIEDTLVVTDVGPRILTQAPRDLTVVG